MTSSYHRHHLWPGLVLAVVGVAAATAMRLALAPVLGGTRFLPFFPVVIATALLAGPVAGVTAIVLSTISLALWFGPGEFEHPFGTAFLLGLFVATGLLTVWLADRVRQERSEMTAADDARLRLAAIVESSDDSIVSKSLDGVIRSWNAAAAELFGYSADEIVGQKISKLVPPDLLPEQAAVVERLRRGERVEPFETIRLHRSGTPTRVALTISPLLGPNGVVIGAVEIARGVGERLRIEADLRRANAVAWQNVAQLRAVIDGMSEGVVVADAIGNLVEWNQPALTAHGYTSIDEVRAHLDTFHERFELSDNERVLPPDEWPMARVLRGETFSGVELRVRRLDAPRELIVDYGGRPVYDASGQLSLAVLTLHDVTVERRAQTALREYAERLSLALDAAGLGDWSWDAATDGVVTSPSAAALYGVPPGTPMTREAMRDFIHEADRDRARRASQQAARSQQDYDIEYRVRRGDEIIWVAAKGRGQYDADGRVTRMLGVVQDITPRKVAEQSLRESREWLELAVSIAHLGTFQLHLRERQLLLNEAGRTIYGYTAGEPLTFEGVSARFHPDDAAAVERRVRESLNPASPHEFDIEHRIVRTDGLVRWIRVRGRTVFDDAGDGSPNVPRPTQCVGTFIDVTEEKETEQWREQLLAAEQAARADAEHASRMKDEFLATLSHELRTPLNAILGWSEILAAGPPGGADFAQGIEVIRRNARSQAQIIEDLLDMSRIISGKVRLNVQAIDLCALADTAVDTVRPTAAAKGVRLLLDCGDAGGPIVGDPARVQQVLWNLLTNAIKFTPRGGAVRLTLKESSACTDLVTAPDAGGCVELAVADTGEGIRPDFLPHVFDRFRQADASITRRHGGLGLGLAIVKQLAELHGGSVRVESAGIGLGATFTVTLPISLTPEMEESAGPAADRPAAAAAPAASVAGLRVLVVDDEPDARGLVKRLLEDREATVVSVASAAEAMTALGGDGGLPDVLVSDIGMPGEDGYALIGRVRAAGLTVPALALTAYARSEDRTRAVTAGFQTHMAKPVDPATLVATVAKLAGR